MELALLSRRLITNFSMELTFRQVFVSSNPAKYAIEYGSEIDKILRKKKNYDFDNLDSDFVTKDIRPKILATNKKDNDCIIVLDVDFIVPDVKSKTDDPPVLTVNVHAGAYTYSFRHFLPSNLKKCYVVDSTPRLIPDESLKLHYVLPIPYLVFQIGEYSCTHVYEPRIQLSDKLFYSLGGFSRGKTMTFNFKQNLRILDKNISSAEFAGEEPEENNACDDI